MRSHAGKVKLDITKLDRMENKLMRRRDKLNVQIFNVKKMKEGLKAAVVTAEAVANAPAKGV